MSTLNTMLTRRYLKNLLSTAHGRAFLLNQVASAEDSDEAQVFDSLLGLVEDATLQKVIARHKEDEKRHAVMFGDAVRRQGYETWPVPDELRVIDRINRALGNAFGQAVEDRADVLRTYLVLQVIEERAITQFALFEQAFRAVDPETADVFAQVAKDEERHLRYCHAVARRYADSDDEHDTMLQRIRDIETRAFAENSRANMQHAMQHGIVEMGAVEAGLWRGISSLAHLGGGRHLRTPYYATGLLGDRSNVPAPTTELDAAAA